MDDVNKQLNDANKQLNDLLNKIKSKPSRYLVNKKLNYIVNNIGNRTSHSPDINLSPNFSSLRNLLDEINKDQSDQVDYNKLAKLTMAKLLPLDPIIIPLDPSITRPTIRTRTRKSIYHKILKHHLVKYLIML